MTDPPGLPAYAEAHGLAAAAPGAATGFDSLLSPDAGENGGVYTGLLGGRTYGAIGHRLLRAGDLAEAGTFAAVLVPETKRTLVALDARAGTVPLDPGVALGPPEAAEGWDVSLHSAADRSLFDELWQGQLGQWLRPNLPGGRLAVGAGVVSVWAPDYLGDRDALDRLVQAALSAGAFAQAVCAPATEPASFDAPLIKPLGWTGPAAGRPDALRAALAPGGDADHLLDPGTTESGAYAGLRDFARAYAEPRGFRIEDGAAFDRAFPGLPFPGWTQVAFSGRLPDGRALRLGVSAQRPYVQNPAAAPGVVFGVSPAATAADHGPEHDPAADLVAGVRAGLRCLWRPFTGMDVGHRAIDAIAAAVIG